MRSKILLLVFTLTLLSVVSYGQNIASSVKGVVVDPAGAAVPGATCTLTNQATAVSLTTKSDDSGICTFLSVLPGTYTLRVEAAGFQMLDVSDIRVTASEIRALGNLRLTVGPIQQAITITAEPTPIQLASAEKSGTITGEQLDRLALKGRDFFALLTTIPGIVDSGTLRRETTTPESIQGTYINGNRDSSKLFTVDGVLNLDTGSNQTVHFQPTMDSIAEIKVLTSNYQAEYGRSSGGVITVITKSGTQSFHGTVYDYYRHESLNANSWLNNRTGTPKAPYRYRITGYNLGGPVYIPHKFNSKKDRLFFFWSQEFTGMRRDFPTRFVNVPTESERRGDFSQSFDATGKLIIVKDPTTGQPFPGNVIPSNLINSTGQAILKFFPLPNYTDPDPAYRYSRNFRSTYSGNYPRRSDMIRIDLNLTSNISLYYRFSHDSDEQDVPWGTWVNGAINWLLSPVKFGQPGRGHAVHITMILSPTLINEFNFGKSYNKLYADLKDPSRAARSLMGNIPEWFSDSTYIPNISFGAGPYPPNPVNASLMGPFPYLNYNDIYSVVDNVSKSWGPHHFKAGIYIERTGKYSPVWVSYRGAFNFTRSALNPYDSGHAFANALLGNFYSYTETTKRLMGDWWFWNVEWYAQDNWRVTKRLTLDAGLRFYHLPAVTDRNGVMSTFDPRFYDGSAAPAMYRPAIDPATGKRVAQNPITGAFAPSVLIGFFVPNTGNTANGMAVPGVKGYPKGLVTTPRLNLGPRIGLAWDVFGDGKTALHGGFGVFYDRPSILTNVYSSGGPPIAYTPTLYFGNLNTFTQTSGNLAPSGLTVFTGKAKTPYTMNFSFGVQHLFREMSVDISYVGGLSRHLWINRNINPIPIGARFDPKNLDPTTGIALPDNFLRPYRGYGDIILQEFAGTSNYNSLQVKVERRYRQGLQYGVAYTFSKALGVQSSEYDAVSPYFNPRRWNYGPLAQDRTHALVINYSYDLPKVGARLNSKPLGWITDNWTISGITSFVSGAPFMPSLGTTDYEDITGSSESARVTVIGDPKSGPRHFNVAAFGRTPKGSFGNASPGMLRGPGINNWDIALAKRILLFSETRYIQFRTETFNAFNHTQYSAIDGSLLFDKSGKQVNPTAGTYTNARSPRIIEFSLKLVF